MVSVLGFSPSTFLGKDAGQPGTQNCLSCTHRKKCKRNSLFLIKGKDRESHSPWGSWGGEGVWVTVAEGSLWQTGSPEDGPHRISLPTCSFDNVILSSPIERWSLRLFPLNLGGTLWLPQPTEYSRSDTLWLLRVDHKRQWFPPGFLFEYLLLEPSCHAVQKPRYTKKSHVVLTDGCSWSPSWQPALTPDSSTSPHLTAST